MCGCARNTTVQQSLLIIECKCVLYTDADRVHLIIHYIGKLMLAIIRKLENMQKIIF